MDLLNALMAVGNEAVELAKNNKEKIFLAGAAVLGVGTAVTTVRATLKCNEIIYQHKLTMLDIEFAGDLNEEYAGSEDQKSDTIKSYVNTGLGIAKEVALPTVLAAGTVACVGGAYCVMNNKIEKLTDTVIGLSAAYTAVDTAFKRYRKNVVNELGKEADERFRFGKTKEKVEEIITDDKGKTKKVKNEIAVINEPDASDYAKFFDCTSGQFVWKDPNKYNPDWDANIHFLNCQQSLANQMLRINGYLFLNDVYELLGIPKTKAGQVVGWIYDPENPTIDSQVSFGTYNICNKKIINCEAGYQYEQCILLDFNVDGVIIDKIDCFDK